MSLLNIIRVKLGQSNTAANNFTLTAEAADGTMKLTRGNPGATTQDILTVDADGRIAHGLTMGTVRLSGMNGYGSTNTAIRRFTTVITNQGADVVYADSATLGASFTVSKAGVYAISYNDALSTAHDGAIGISINSNQLTTPIINITAAHRLAIAGGSAQALVQVSSVVYCSAGDIIRAHGQGSASSANAAFGQFTITRVS